MTALVVACAAVSSSSCSSSPAMPSTSSVVTFRVVDETFKILLGDPAQIDLARRVLAGTVKRFPNGRIQSGADVNAPWSWHLSDVELVEASIEVCDGRPSDVEKAGVSYGGGRFCPWSATVVSIVDR